MMQRNTLNVRCIKRIYGEAEVPPHILYQTQVVTADYSESEARMFWNKDSIFSLNFKKWIFFFFPALYLREILSRDLFLLWPCSSQYQPVPY